MTLAARQGDIDDYLRKNYAFKFSIYAIAATSR